MTTRNTPAWDVPGDEQPPRQPPVEPRGSVYGSSRTMGQPPVPELPSPPGQPPHGRPQVPGQPLYGRPPYGYYESRDDRAHGDQHSAGGPSGRGVPHDGGEHHHHYGEDPDDEDAESGGRVVRSHSHSHDTSVPVSAHTRRIVMAILIPSIILTAVGMILLWPGSVPRLPAQQGTDQRAYGEVLAIKTAACPQGSTSTGPKLPCGTAAVHISSGPGSGKTVGVALPQGPGAPALANGDKVLLSFTPDAVAGLPSYSIVDEQRGQPILFMVAMCAAIIVVFGRWRGLTALIGLGVSFAVLLWFVIPAILHGESPLTVAIVGSAAMMFAVLYLTHGINVHTSVAVLGTLAALVVTGLLGAAFTATTKLTGFGSDETLNLSVMQGNVDMRGLLLAGIIIGALGLLPDLTVTQAAAVAELAEGATSRLDVYRAATRIGRAHMASAVNTIILVYAGTSLPLLLLVAAGGSKISDLLTSQFLAQEIVRTAVGTIGLVAAVPITTALAALVADIHPHPRTPPAAAGS